MSCLTSTYFSSTANSPTPSSKFVSCSRFAVRSRVVICSAAPPNSRAAFWLPFDPTVRITYGLSLDPDPRQRCVFEDIRVIATGRFLFQCIKHLHPAALLLPQLADASFISRLLSFLDFALQSAEPSVGCQSLQRT